MGPAPQLEARSEMPDHERREWRRLLATVLGLALGIHLLALAPFYDARAVFDEAYYLSVAAGILEGRGHTDGMAASTQPSAGKPPLYPALLAAVRAMPGPDLPALRSFQIIPSLITVFLVFSLAARRFGPRAGFVSAALCALSPSLIHYGHLLWPECLAAMLLTAFIWFAERYERLGRTRELVFAGLTLGVLSLTKSAWPYFGAVVVVWLFARKRSWRGSLAPAAAFALAGALVVLPWSARNYREFDRFILIADQTWFAIAVGNLYPADNWYLGQPDARERKQLMAVAKRLPESQRDAFYRDVSLQVIGGHQPWWILQKLIRAPAALYSLQTGQLRFIENGWIEPQPWLARALVIYDVLGHYLTLIPGLLALWLVPGDRIKALIVAAILYLNAIHVLANAFPRYHVVLLPLLLLYAGPLITGAFDRRRARPWQWAGAIATALAFVLIPLPRSWAYVSSVWASIG